MIDGKRILITGMAGSIGSELARQLAPGNKLFGVDINESDLFLLREELRRGGHWVHTRTGDIRNKATISDVFEDFKPELVFHAAALKHVTPNEEYPIEAIETNIIGTYNVAAEAKRWECVEKFVFISTDKVVNSHCIMGITKKCAEGIITRSGHQFVAVRFGNVLGSRGSVLEIWKKQVESGLPITITDPNMERFVMTIADACSLVITAAERGNNGDIYILDMGERLTIMELADAFLGGQEYPIDIIGSRPGETQVEQLMTTEEREKAIKDEQFFIIKSS